MRACSPLGVWKRQPRLRRNSSSRIDPYTREVSDVYQDVFEEGSFIGKGIYDVDAFRRAMSKRFPENAILSHDLLEACHARSGLVSDVTFYEDYPSRYIVDVERRHRWIDPAAFAFELAYTYEALGSTEQMIDEYLNLLASNPQQMTLVQNRLQAWLSDDVDNTKNDTYRKVLLKKSQQNPDEILYNELLLWHSIQQKDFPFAIVQAKALDRRYGENGQRIFDLAALCVSNENYDAAIEGYMYIIQKKAQKDIVMRSRIELINTQFVQYKKSYSQDKNRLLLMKQEYIQLLDEIGKTAFTIPLILNLAHLQAFYLGETDAAIALLLQAINIPNVLVTSQAECKLELADIYLFSDEQWEATLLYSQVEKTFKNEPIGHEAKFRNAKLSFYIGEFGWALAQLDVLKAATSKLIANDALELSLIISDNIEEDSITVPLSMYAKSDLLEFRNRD